MRAPFPHIVLDDFFDPVILDRVLTEFPSPGGIQWQRFDNEKEIKLASASESSFGPITRLFLYHLNSSTFLEFLSKVTGVANLIPDPCFDGSTDFTYHGQPDPLQCPAGMTRKSLALYYFSNGRAAEEVSNGKHSTLFHNRPGEEYRPTFKQRM